MLFKKKHVELTEEQKEEIRIKDFFDRVLPSTIKFYTDTTSSVTVTAVYGQ